MPAANTQDTIKALLSGDTMPIEDLNADILKILQNPRALAEIAAKLLENGQTITQKIDINPLSIEVDHNLIQDALKHGKDHFAHVLINKNGEIAFNDSKSKPSVAPINENVEPVNIDENTPNYVPEIIKYTYPEIIESYKEVYEILETDYVEIQNVLKGKYIGTELQSALGKFMENINFLPEELSRESAELNPNPIPPEKAVEVILDQLRQKYGNTPTLDDLQRKLEKTNQSVLGHPKNLSHNIDEHARDNMYAAAFKIPQGMISQGFAQAHSSPQQPQNEPTQAPNLTQDQPAFALT